MLIVKPGEVLSCGPPPPLSSERRGTGSKQNIPLLKEMIHPIYPRLSTFIPVYPVNTNYIYTYLYVSILYILLWCIILQGENYDYDKYETKRNGYG